MRNPAPITLAAYKQKIATCKTILQQVRELPDQTLEQAMARTHHEAQREGPVMLSLSCDNNKFVVERDGTLRFQATTNLAGDWFATAGAMHPRAVSTAAGCRSRSSPPKTMACCIVSGCLSRRAMSRGTTRSALTGCQFA